jgi:hypothetical protein
MLSPKFTKDPNAVLDYAIDWSDWLEVDDEIESAEWIVPEGITKDKQEESTSAAVIWLSGGTVGTKYNLTCRITTTEGRTDDRTICVKIKEK